MENQDLYYLIENQTLLITNRKTNAKAIITENDGEIISGLFIEEKKHFFFNRFTCMVDEFDQIFSKVSILYLKKTAI
ncbi:hypothetical protein SAMN05443667_101261 [Flavobacterium gillisiae]|uniref:Uncharacterized protein n=1 Tax=Flavobacterium gillisiae TaxID=150146 RepID=A0A1H3WW08_9FLAO|nr:hypothetical protein [Flavobacterium gillisiae]SDZ91160.1 hypothetical protein SAMN05443667_101261 [Flavobacterium gillisiae]